ncbi:F0F1 ATP synthase subunit epsilon [Gammaproteobacteria bacterium]|jgi:F-type H+-transporting ATPase subunit epsilon|uniref:ATP synthase epsilon chain n=1 Tax=OM182 bacterium MED-G28 TaxID=1986256 RepID=A0A2A5WDY9_9GAMM|nr:F0F1 ATP synthase subunit epsilon [Gammaproteobacteria bacterium]MDC0221372.1 F0F1 ATP synthase subunit epsilon [Gammaproteobacteria bacterium]PDH34498.1 MAG: F0F1 ATP synthase subunit epsilon [OM182 bacterium MED-G28]|tara:strand:+ start:367 stop:780 length:414 start_codon:yes stop_codon:yes gene_type:complete
MATTMHCDIVSAEKSIFSGRVQMVIAAGSLGDLGIAPGHAPLLTAIIPGPVKLILESGEEEVFYVSGGFLEIQREVVTLLSDTAIRADDVDEVAAVKAVEDAEKAIANQGAEFEYSAAAAQLAEAAAQLRALRQIKK